MNVIFKRQIPRRTFLRGAGGVMALPLLDAMIPALGRADTAKGPARMAVVYFPNGVQVDSWYLKAENDIIPLPEKLPRTLEPPSGQCLDATLEFELRESGRECSSTEAGVHCEFVDGHRGVSHGFKHRVVARGLLFGIFKRAIASSQSEFAQHVVGIFHEHRSLLDQPVTAF